MQKINNAFYDDLGERWYSANNDPVALLRSESKEKIKWALPLLKTHRCRKVLDVACGAGFVSNPLGAKGFEVVGTDLSESSLETARRYDRKRTVRYLEADANELPFKNEEFDSVLCFDFLEHVDNPELIIKECSRVLKPGGIFLFHTINRNLLTRIIVVNGVEWFVKNVPRQMHVYRLFVKPREIETYCRRHSMEVKGWTGIRPQIDRAFFKLLRSGVVPKNFKFKQTRSLGLSYCGWAQKEGV